MQRTAIRLILGTGLLLAGWSVGRAQTAAPDFELIITAPPGVTKIDCPRGCKIAWVERGLNPKAKAVATMEFACGGKDHCTSGRVGGWVEPR